MEITANAQTPDDDQPFVEPKGYEPTLGERMAENFWEALGGSLSGSAVTGARTIGKNFGPTPEDRELAKAQLQDRAIQKAQYDAMQWSRTPLEFGAAFAGQTGGALLSPESLINRLPGLGGLLGSAAGRIGSFAFSQGVVNVGQDAVAQAVDIAAGLRKEYDLAQSGLSFGLGMLIGGAFGGIGEISAHYRPYRRGATDKPTPVEQPKSDAEIAREDLSRAAAEDPSLQSNDIQPPPSQTPPSRAAEAGEVVPPSATQPPPPRPDPEAVARQQNADLFAKIDDLETRIDQTRAALDERIGQQSADAPDLVGGRRAELEAELAGFTGKRRSSPRAEALREELARLQEQTSGIVEAETARFASDEQMLRLRLNDLQQQRAALGPDYRAAMERAQQDIAARPVEAPPATEAPASRPEAAAPLAEAATPAPESVLGQTVADASPSKPTAQPAPSNVIPLPQRPKVQALDQIAAKVASGEASPRAAADEMRAALAEARAAAQAAPQTPAILNRLRMLDEIEREIAAATGGSTARDVEASVRQAFGRDGARLVDQGNVKIVQSVDQLPKRPDGVAHPDDVKGLYDGKTAYLVADNLTPGEARGVLLHEVGTHAGLRQMLGDNLFAQVLAEVEAKSKQVGVRENPFAEAARAVPEDTFPAHRAEEMLAYLVENAPELPLVQRVLASIRQWAYRFLGGRFIDLTEADLREMAVAALRQWKGETGPDGIVYSRGSSVGYRTGEENLSKYGLEPGGRYNTRDIAAAMEARQRAKIGTIARDDFSDATAKKISKWMAEEVKYAVDQAAKGIDTGVGWYSGKFQRALDTFGEVFPELKTDPTKRDFFTALVAIMSDGQKVHNNFVYAARMYDLYRQGKPLPTDVTFGGERSTSMNTNLRAINHLVEQYGEEGMGKYLMQEFTVSQLAKMAKEAGVSFSTSYKANQTLPMAALVFGPKLGAFYSNLMGSHGYLTMDRWWTRTFNRYRGQLLSKVVGTADAPTNAKGEPIGLARFKQMLGETGISDEEALTRLSDFRDAYEAKGYKNGTDIEKAANTLYKDAFVNLEDQPFNASDREFMIKTANEAQKQLQKQGVDLSIADIQAVLWYYEKRLYGELGARQSADVSYEEAAARVVRESRGAGPDRWVAQDAGGDVIPGPDGSLVEVVGKQGPDAASSDIQQRRGDAARAGQEASAPDLNAKPEIDRTALGADAAFPADAPDFRYSRRQADPEAVARQVEALKSQIQGLDRDLAGKTDEGLQRRTQTAGAPTQPGQQAAATTPPGETPEVLSLQQQSMKLAEVLDLPTYQGRVQGGQAVVGQFDSRQGVVRVRQIADFPTVAHEAAHAMEQRVGRPLQDLIQNYATELGPLDNTGNMNPREGFAIWAENWIINPATGPKTAPQFAQAFERTMRDSAPDVWTAMTDAQAAYKAWNDSSPGQKVGAIVQTQTPDTVLKTLKEEGLPRSVSLAVAKIYDGLFDDKSVVTQAVRSIVRMARDASGVKMSLEGADNPENLVRLFARNAQAATRDMLDGVRGYREIAPSTPGLRDAIIMATGQSGKLGVWDTEAVKTFSDYLVLRRAQVLYDKFDQGDLARRPLAMTKGDVLAGLAEMEAANPNLAAGAQMVHDYTRGLLKKMFDAGLIDADLFGKLMKEDFYVPLYRDMSDKPKAGAALSSSPEGPGRTDLVKRLQGSDRDIIDPIQSLMMQTFLVNRTVQHNDIIRSFVTLARQAQALGAQGTGRILEEIPAHQLVGQKFNLQETLAAAAKKRGIDGMDLDVLTNAVADVFGSDPILATVFRAEPTGRKGEPIVFYKDGGQLKAVRFTAGEEGMALYEALSQLPPAARDWALAAGQMSASALRAGIVTNPVFAITNYTRDQLAAAILRPNYLPFDPRGVVSELRQDRWAELYTYAGGVSPGAGAQGLHDMVDRSIDALAAKGWAVQKLSGLSKLVTGSGVERVAGPAKAIGEVVETAEAGTRLNVMRTVFEQKKAQGLSDYDAMIEAAAQATGLMDFGRHGSGTLYIRTLVPFLNAHLQGIDKAWQTMVTPIYRALKGDVLTVQDEQALKNAGLTWFKMAGVGGALGYMYSLWAQNHRSYQDANDELRATHLIIPGSAFGYDGKILVIPKPFELAMGFNLGEMAGMALKAGDPRAASFALAGMMEVIAPPNVLSSIPIVKNFAELTLNKSFFTKRDIVPERLQALKPEEQYTEKTSSFARAIGSALGVSPVKVDYAIGSTFGLYGRDLLALSNTADPRAPAPSLYDQMFVRRFIKSADSASETTKRFWDQAAARNGQLAKAKASYENMLGQFRDDDAMRFLGALPKQERSFVVLNSAAGEDGKPAFRADDKRMHPLVRAATASTTISGMVRELSNDAQKVYEDGGRIAMDPQKRRDVIEQLRVLAAMEQYNALVIMKDKGYEGRRLEDTAKQLEVIRAHSSSAADEIMTRYATGKIPSGAAIAKVWPEMERRLLADGGKADIRDLTADVLAEGWEFGGERVKRPQKRRIEIPQRVLAPAQ